MWQLISDVCGDKCCNNLRMGDHVRRLVDDEPTTPTALPPDVVELIKQARKVYERQVEINNEETLLRFRAAFGEIAELKRLLDCLED